jgi:hypothetical protein
VLLQKVDRVLAYGFGEIDVAAGEACIGKAHVVGECYNEVRPETAADFRNVLRSVAGSLYRVSELL